MVRAVRGAGEQRPAQQATPERVQEREGGPKVERHELPGVPSAPERAHASRELGRDDERRDATQQIYAELDHIHPYDRPQTADPSVDERHDPDGEDPGGEVPAGDDGQRDRRREDAHAVGERAGEEEDRSEERRVGKECRWWW